MKVLIAEDSSVVRRLVAARLIADGYEVVEAADGEEALALTRRDLPDLVVLDKVIPSWTVSKLSAPCERIRRRRQSRL